MKKVLIIMGPEKDLRAIEKSLSLRARRTPGMKLFLTGIPDDAEPVEVDDEIVSALAGEEVIEVQTSTTSDAADVEIQGNEQEPEDEANAKAEADFAAAEQLKSDNAAAEQEAKDKVTAAEKAASKPKSNAKK
jgi:hypothetical protein